MTFPSFTIVAFFIDCSSLGTLSVSLSFLLSLLYYYTPFPSSHFRSLSFDAVVVGFGYLTLSVFKSVYRKVAVNERTILVVVDR